MSDKLLTEKDLEFLTLKGGCTGSSHNVSKGAKIRNRYNQVPHMTQDTNGKVTSPQQTPQTRAKRSALSQPFHNATLLEIPCHGSLVEEH